jgi:type IV secretory pathway TrbD component
VEVNGQAVAPATGMKISSNGKKLQIKASQSELNLQSGTNRVVVVSNGIRSNAFAFNL